LTTNDVSELYSYVTNGFYIKMYTYSITVRILVTNTVAFDHVLMRYDEISFCFVLCSLDHVYYDSVV